MKCQYTRTGQPYVSRADICGDRAVDKYSLIDSDNISSDNISSDNISSDIPVLSDLSLIEKKYGLGTRLYFSFLKTLIVYNGLLSVLGIISWSLYMSDRNGNIPFQWSDFFVSAYIRNVSEPYWFGINVVIFVSWFCWVPAYCIWETFFFHSSTPVFMLLKNDSIHDNVTRPICILGSICICLGYLIVSAGILAGLVKAQSVVVSNNNDNLFGTSLTLGTLMGLVVSLGYSLLNVVWNYCSLLLTTKEGLPTWSAFRMSQTAKLVIYRVVITVLLYLFVSLLVGTSNNNSCSFLYSGINFFSLLITDAVVNMLVSLVIPLILRKKKKPEFNLAEELLIVLHRQFLINLGILVFPLLGVVGFVLNSIEYFVDRYRILRVNAEPKYIQEKPGKFLFVFGLIIALSCTLAYPNGILWLIFQPTLLPQGFNNCSMYNAISRL